LCSRSSGSNTGACCSSGSVKVTLAAVADRESGSG
jgi:hypothetical protein